MFTKEVVAESKTGAAAMDALKNVVEIMFGLMEDDPNAPKETIIDRWWKIVGDDEDCREAIRCCMGTHIWETVVVELQRAAAEHAEKMLKLE